MSNPRKRLGKGLGALLGEAAVEAARTEKPATATDIAVSHIVPNRFQPRQTFDEGRIADLAASIAQKGLLQPLIVTPRGDGEYELVSGERRWRAAQRVGLPKVPVIVREDVDDRELLEIALIENLQREDLDPIEEATGFRQLIEDFELTQAELGTHVGKSRPAIANTMRLLELPDHVQTMVKEGVLTAGHGRALLGLSEARRIEPVARRTAKRGLSVRQLESLVKRENRNAATETDQGASPEDLERERLAEVLQQALGTRVEIRSTKKGKGSIQIAFYSYEDLERLVEKLQLASG